MPEDASPRRCSANLLPSPLYVVCDDDVCVRAGWTLTDFAKAALDAGARILQIRAKHASGRTLLEMSRRVIEVARASGALVVVNDRADIARMAGAGGVHVGQDDLLPSSVRRMVGPEAVVGLSTHTLDQVERGCDEPVEYLAIGPVFPTLTKDSVSAAVGLEGVEGAASIADAHAMPVIAIGGMTLDRAPAVIRAGASGVAVVSDLFIAGDPAARIKAYLKALASPHG